MMEGIQYQVDSGGHKTAVVIDLERHGSLWEDFYDLMLIESRKDEPRETLEAVEARLRSTERRREDGGV